MNTEVEQGTGMLADRRTGQRRPNREYNGIESWEQEGHRVKPETTNCLKNMAHDSKVEWSCPIGSHRKVVLVREEKEMVSRHGRQAMAMKQHGTLAQVVAR